MATGVSRLRAFPRQKLSLSKKSEAWGIKNIEAGIGLSQFDSQLGPREAGIGLRTTFNAKRVNYDLASGIMDDSDLEKAFNPMGIKGVEFPAKTQNYPIEVPKFNVLKGEETRRNFDWRVRTSNEDAYSMKEDAKKDQLWAIIMDELQNQNFDEAKAEKRIKDLGKYLNYEYQDLRELAAARVLNYLWNEQKLKHMFSEGFYDVMIAAEEIYCAEKIAGEPVGRRCNPLNISTLRSGESHRVEDSDIIVEDGYRSVGSVIDDYYEDLSDKNIKDIEDGKELGRLAGTQVISGPIDVEKETFELGNSQLITVDARHTKAFGGAYDIDGNIRVVRVVWKSMRKLGELTYFDENGDEQKDTVDETYKLDKEKGEKVKWEWVSEWWTGTRIGPDIYIRVQPLPRYGSHISNVSICRPPYVGTVYAINSNQAVSLMDRVKPYKYLYNVFMRRSLMAAARDKGVLPEMDMARVPEGWSPEMWFMYAEQNGYFVVDSFKEGTKGVATGKLAGNMQIGNRTYDLRNSDSVVLNLNAAKMAKDEMAEVAGITPERTGEQQNRQTLGGVQDSVARSSFITEEWFALHDNTKIRFMELMLEVAQEAWRGKNKKLEYIDDGLASTIFEIDGTELADSEFGLYLSDGSNDTQLISTIQQLAHAAMQNDQANLPDLIDVLRERSVSASIRKLERAQETRDAKVAEAQQQQIDGAMQVEEVKRATKQDELESKERIEMAKIENQQILEKMRLDSGLLGNFFAGTNDDNRNNIDDDVEIEKEVIRGKQKEKELKADAAEAEKDRKHESAEKAKDRKSQEKIASKRTVAKKQ